MPQAVYEHHTYNDPQLPFLCHRDEVYSSELGGLHWHEHLEFLHGISGSAQVSAQHYPLETGDLVVYKAPYYHIDGQGMYLVRRISGIRNDMVEVTADAQVPRAETEIIEKDIILGKVIRTWVKKNAS